MAGFMLKYFLVPLVVIIIRLVVFIYTWITLPIYFLYQQPWKRLDLAKQCGARLSNKGRWSDQAPCERIGTNFIEYERFAEVPYHPLMDCKTILEALMVCKKLYPSDHICQGYREILDEEIQYDSNGKPIMVDGKMLRKYKLSEYRWQTMNETIELMYALGRGLSAIGLQKGDLVVVYAETGRHFLNSVLATNCFGGKVVTLFNTLHDDGIIHAINETEPNFIITSFELVDRVSRLIDQCSSIKHVIYYEGPRKRTPPTFPKHVKLWLYSDLQEMGRSEKYCHLEASPLAPEEDYIIMYTSGTTGTPKGVVANGIQVKESAMGCGQVVRDVIMDGPNHTYIAYLPQAHILELSIELFLLIGGVKIGFGTPFTLNESAPGLVQGQICDLKLLKPTVMTAVPLVLDRMKKEIYTKLAQRTPFSKDIFDCLLEYKTYWTQKGYQTPIVNKLLCSKVQEQFGNRLQYMVVGSAPLAPNLQSLIRNSLEVTLIQGYGSTETMGGVMCMDFHDLSFGRVGAPLNGVRVRLIDWPEAGYSINDKPNPRGEILIGGLMITRGYYKLDDQTTLNYFNENGFRWFITGDIGEVFPDGTFKIIDRKKDLIKLANGEFISLGKIEAALKGNQYVDNVCIFADGIINGLVALVVPNQRAFTDLAIKKFGHDTRMTFYQMCSNELLINYIHENLISTGFENQLKPIELPSLITLCHEEWTPDNNLLTAAMKLKRVNIARKHSADVRNMFETLRNNPAQYVQKTKRQKLQS